MKYFGVYHWYVKILQYGYYETWIRLYYVLSSKTHISPLAICSNPPLVRDKPLRAPAFVRLNFQQVLRANSLLLRQRLRTWCGNVAHLPCWLPHFRDWVCSAMHGCGDGDDGGFEWNHWLKLLANSNRGSEKSMAENQNSINQQVFGNPLVKTELSAYKLHFQTKLNYNYSSII